MADAGATLTTVDLSREQGAPDNVGASWLRSVAPAFRFIDLFAGIGGIRLGLEQAGGLCVYSAEIDAPARRTYEANFGSCEGWDIADVDTRLLPQYDILAAGFPCQPFSIAGVSKKNSLGRLHGFEDATSGNLFFKMLRFMGGPNRPPVLFLENVKNLMSHDRGNTWRIILGVLDGLGYEVRHKVIDARSWVPQHRERTFIIGLHRDIFDGQAFEFPATPPPEAGPRLKSILEPADTIDPKYILTEHLWVYLQAYAAKHRAAGNGFGYGLADPEGVTRTLSARYYKDGSEILIPLPGRGPRRLTPRECARLMGYPDTFAIPVSDMQAYKQFGNSVVVPVVRHIGEALVAQVAPSERLAAVG